MTVKWLKLGADVEIKQVAVRMPMALWIDIADEAERRNHSINAEINRRLGLKKWANRADHDHRNAYEKRKLEEARNVQDVKDEHDTIDWLNR